MTEMRLPDQGDPVEEAATRAELAPAETVGLEGVATDHQLPPRSSPSHAASTDGVLDPETARRGILETRSRMSETIDQIEEQLLRRKERLQARLDVRGQLREQLTPVREVVEARPLAVLGGALLLGAAVGYLTGGGDGRGEALDDLGPEHRNEWRRRASRWESRSRELMRINAELEGEVRRLRADLGDAPDEEEGGWLSGLAGAFGAMLARRATGSRTLVELEEADLPGDYHPSASYEHFAHGQRTREPDDPLQG